MQRRSKGLPNRKKLPETQVTQKTQITMKITRFEEIDAWQEARNLVNLIYDAIRANSDFKKDFRLVGQIQGAAVSSMSNTCPVK